MEGRVYGVNLSFRSHIRNERRKKQRQRLATQRARQEAAAELRELATDGPLRPAEADRDSSGTESDTPPERSESVPRPAVRGLFLAETVTQAPPAQPEPAVFQHPPGATVATPPPTAPTRPFWMTGMATQQPPAKRGKGGPAPGRGQSVHPANSAHRPLARPPLRPLATQALPFPGPRPMLQTPAASVLHKPVPPSFPVSAPTAHPPAPVGAPLLAVHQNPSNAASSGPATRTVVIRPQARRATPVSAVPQSGPRPAGPSAGPPARGATTSLPAEARSQAPAPAVTQLRRSTEPGQEPQQAQRPAPAGTLLSMQTTSIAEMPSSTIGPRPETSEPLPTPVANSGGRTAPSASGGPPPPVGRVGIAQQTRPGPAQETRHSSPRIQIEKSQHAADLERLAVPVAAQPRAPPAAPSASAPASPKPWKTRQRQPKAVKAQQKAREAEERRRKQAAKDAEKRSAQEAQKAAQEAAAAESGAANCSTGGSGRGPSSTHRPPKVTVHKLPGARGNGLPPPGAARVTHITTGHGNQGSRRPTGSGVGAPPSGPQSVAHPHTWAGPRPPSLAHPPPLVPPDLLNQVRPQGSLPERPHPLAHGHVRQAAAVHASTHPRPGASLHPPAYPDALHSAAGNGSLAGAWSGEEARQRGAVPAMERDELTDSDEEDTWQRNGLPYARTGGLATGTLSADRDALQSVKGHALGQEVEGHAAGEGREDEERRYAEPEGGLGAAMEAATGGRHGASAGMPEMERDELTDSDDEDHVAERGARGGSPGWGRRGSEAAAREVEMERDELTDSDEDAAGSGGEEDGGEDEGHAGHDLIRGFLMEQDELTESDEDQGEEDWGGGPGAATAGTPEVGGRRSEAPYGVFQQRNENSQASGGLTASLSPVQMATAEGNLTGEESNGPRQVGAQGGGALWERSVTFERDELEDSDDDEKGGKDGAGGRFEQDQVTESDDDDS